MSHEDAIERLITSLWRPPAPLEPRLYTRVYAILDCARDLRIYKAISETGLVHRCLFTGKLEPVLARAAPYLVELEPEAALVRLLLSQGWGHAWGIFAVSPADIEEMRRHFRRFLRVVDERGRRLFFRYYDPRVLRAYLPTCNEGELRTVFGPVFRYVLEDGTTEGILELSIRSGELVSTKIKPPGRARPIIVAPR